MSCKKTKGLAKELAEKVSLAEKSPEPVKVVEPKK
jgi:hypothetical protein